MGKGVLMVHKPLYLSSNSNWVKNNVLSPTQMKYWAVLYVKISAVLCWKLWSQTSGVRIDEKWGTTMNLRCSKGSEKERKPNLMFSDLVLWNWCMNMNNPLLQKEGYPPHILVEMETFCLGLKKKGKETRLRHALLSLITGLCWPYNTVGEIWHQRC